MYKFMVNRNVYYLSHYTDFPDQIWAGMKQSSWLQFSWNLTPHKVAAALQDVFPHTYILKASRHIEMSLLKDMKDEVF